MADADISQLEQRLLADSALRAHFRKAPDEVLQTHGIEVTPERREKLARHNLSSMEDDDFRGRLETEGLRAML
jgi:hypothetical protein